MTCCSCSKQGDRLRLPEARSAVPWPGACPAVLLQHSLLPPPLPLALRPWVSLRAPLVFLVLDSGPLPECAQRAPQCFSRPLKLPHVSWATTPTSSSTFAHTLPVTSTRPSDARPSAGPRNNRTAENHFSSKTVTRPYAWRVARGRPQTHTPRRAPET